jgi:hypothetical protein
VPIASEDRKTKQATAVSLERQVMEERICMKVVANFEEGRQGGLVAIGAITADV